MKFRLNLGDQDLAYRHTDSEYTNQLCLITSINGLMFFIKSCCWPKLNPINEDNADGFLKGKCIIIIDCLEVFTDSEYTNLLCLITSMNDLMFFTKSCPFLFAGQLETN